MLKVHKSRQDSRDRRKRLCWPPPWWFLSRNAPSSIPISAGETHVPTSSQTWYRPPLPSTPRNQSEYQGDRAESYDSRRTSEAKWQTEQATFEVFLALAAPTPARIVDVPVGTGRFLELYATHGHEVIGIDVSIDMLAQAILKQEQLGGSNITLRVGDITALDMESDSVDVAACIRLFNLVDAAFVERALNELARVATGHLIVGIRSHGRHGGIRRISRRVRSLLSDKPNKLVIHSHSTVYRFFDVIGATVVERRLIATGAHRSSEYVMYLLALPT